MILRCSLGWQRRRPTCSTYDSRVAICHGPCGLFFLFSFFAPSSAFAMIELHVWCREHRLDNRLSPRLLPSQQAKTPRHRGDNLPFTLGKAVYEIFLPWDPWSTRRKGGNLKPASWNYQIFALPMYSPIPRLRISSLSAEWFPGKGEKGQVESKKKKDSKIKDVMVFLIDVGVCSKPQNNHSNLRL
jgi:hypothetical protein